MEMGGTQGWTLSVSQLNEYVRRQMAADPVLSHVRVHGEISGFKRAASGHLFFALKDDTARVQCAMFRQNAIRLRFLPQDGMRVVISGSASLYAQTGSYQVYAEEMQPAGVGEMYLRFEALKQRLSEEGLFDPALKRELPLLPRCVGIATSATGAVLHDILRVGWSRCPNMRFLLAPCSVQGEQAAGEIVSALHALGESGECDVILCGRGGGSLEDLWPFNEEQVARAIRGCAVPVVSCVGHETDYTIADLAADVRAATPSAAAQIAIPEQTVLMAELRALQTRLDSAVTGRIAAHRETLRRLTRGMAFADPSRAWVQPRRQRLREQELHMWAAYEKRLQEERASLRLKAAKLDALRPGAPLERGYALVMRNGEYQDSTAAIRKGDLLQLILRDGQVLAEAMEVQKGRDA